MRCSDLNDLQCEVVDGTILKPEVSIVVPTYREAENLEELLVRISAALSSAGLPWEVIVVDDDSPDDTSAICGRLAETYPLRLIVRRNERGLSSAVIHGLEIAQGVALVVMDADLSHPPEQIPALVNSLKTSKFAIGSRYISGGATEDRWSLARRLLSRSATLLARPLTSVSDPMSGFFSLSRETYRDVADRLTPVGYKIGLELIVKLNCRDVNEVPIFFEDRKRGVSKLTFREQLRYLRHLTRLYGYRLRQTFFRTGRWQPKSQQ
jgi:dolichol-phosphate mannosyltransferase